MVVLVCASCNGNGEKTDPDREGQIIVATWNKGNIWSGDVFEWVNYFYSLYYSDIQGGVRTTKDILELSIRAYCLVPLLENYLKEIGKTVSEDAIEIGVLQMMMNIDEQYSEEGGFEYWKNGVGVTDNFIYDYVKYGIYNSAVREYLVENYDVSEEKLVEYFNENSMDYATPVGYIFNTALCEVLDQSNDEEWNTVFEDAKSYITKANSGTSFSDIQDEIKAKYTTEDGYVLVPYYTTYGTLTKVDLDSMPKFDDLDKYIEELKAKYTEKGMDRTAEKTSAEYGYYDEYMFYVYQGTVAYIFRNKLLEIGETYETPIQHPEGWMIVEYDSYNSNPWAKYEDVKEQVKSDYLESIQDDLLIDFCSQLLDKNNLSIEDVEFVPNSETTTTSK